MTTQLLQLIAAAAANTTTTPATPATPQVMKAGSELGYVLTFTYTAEDDDEDGLHQHERWKGSARQVDAAAWAG